MRALRDRPTALERWPKGVPRGHHAQHRLRRQGRRVLPEAGAEGRARLRRDGDRHLPVGAHRRRGLPDRDRRRRRGRADGHADVPPLAGAPRPRPTTPTSCASTSTRTAAPTSATRSGSPGSRASCSPTSGMVGFPKTSGNRGVHVYVRIEPRWDFVDVRHAAIAFGRELERRTHGVTTNWWKEERGDADLRRLQPERPRPHDRLGLQPAAQARARRCRTPMEWDELAEVARPGGLQPVHGARAVRRARRRARGDRRRRTATCSRCWTCTTSRAAGRAELPARLPEDAGRAAARAAQQEGRRRTGTRTATGSRGLTIPRARAPTPPTARGAVRALPRLLPRDRRSRKVAALLRRGRAAQQSRLPSGWTPHRAAHPPRPHGAALVRVGLPRRGRRRPVG